MTRPYISIPKYPESGQPRVLADREEEIRGLYSSITRAGNALRQGNRTVRHRRVVHGYRGVGKSSIIVEALAMLRGDSERNPSQLGLPEPLEPHRWLILRVSGKNAPSIDALPDAILQGTSDPGEALDGDRALLSLLDETTGGAKERISSITSPTRFYHRLFPTKETKLYQKVRSNLHATLHAIEFVKNWHGATRTRGISSNASAENSSQAEASILAELAAQAGEPSSTEARNGMKLAASYLSKRIQASSHKEDLEHQSRVSAQLVVEMLNRFLQTTQEAQLPTVLVIDDLDEVTSSVGPSVENRSRILASIFKPLRDLTPTCLIFGLREEYMHEDIRRGAELDRIAPMMASAKEELLEAWGKIQTPELTPEQMGKFKGLGEILLGKFDPQDRILVPLTFLEFTQWLNNDVIDTDRTEKSLIKDYLNRNFGHEISEICETLARQMPKEHIRRCAAAEPLDPSPYPLTKEDRCAMEHSGLLRPAMAGDPGDPRIVLDPLIGCLRMATGE